MFSKFYFKITSSLIFLMTLVLSKDAFAQTVDATKGTATIANNIGDVTKDQIETARNLVMMISEFFVKYSFQVLGGLVVLFLGWLAGRYISNLIVKFLSTKKLDITVTKFIGSAVNLVVMTFALIVAMGKFGIDVAPLIAGLSVAGLGLSFALQGPLSNYAAGFTSLTIA